MTPDLSHLHALQEAAWYPYEVGVQKAWPGSRVGAIRKGKWRPLTPSTLVTNGHWPPGLGGIEREGKGESWHWVPTPFPGPALPSFLGFSFPARAVGPAGLG